MNRLLVLAMTALIAAPALAQDKPAAKSPTAVITLEKGGEIRLEFFTADAPKHVENFLKLARAGFYDGQRFHRVEPGFVVQLGDPQSKTLPMDHPDMGTGGPGYTIKCEINPQKHGTGSLSMAHAGKDTGGSQFFITLSPQPHLDGSYTVFGYVVKGMDVVDKIRPGDVIERVEIWAGP